MKDVASEIGCCFFEILFDTGFYSAGWLEAIGELVFLPKETFSQRRLYVYLTVKTSTLTMVFGKICFKVSVGDGWLC